MKINELTIRKIIRDVILRESTGISDDVQYYTDELVGLLTGGMDRMEYAEGTYFWNRDGNPVNVMMETIKVGTVSFHDVLTFKHISFTVYDFVDLETAKAVFPKLGLESSYSSDDGRLDIVCFSVKGRLYMPLLRRAVSHEMMHYLKSTYLNYDKRGGLYVDALKIINTSEKEDINTTIAWVLHMLDNEEIHSNCQGGFNDGVGKKLKTMADIREESALYKDYEFISGCVSKINSGAYDGDYDGRLFSGVSLDKIRRIIDCQMEYYRKKIFRIFHRIIMHNNKPINERLVIMRPVGKFII